MKNHWTALALWGLAACGPQAAAKSLEEGRWEIREDITIKSKSRSGAPLQLPHPKAGKPIIDEVIGSLELYTSQASPKELEMLVSEPKDAQDIAFPKPPFLIFSAQSILAPYQSWTLEVLAAQTVVWRASGDGNLRESVEWDGSGFSGEPAIRIETPFRFLFTARNDGQDLKFKSAPVSFKSLQLKGFMGETQMEVANGALFNDGKSRFKDGALKYLNLIAERLRLVELKEQPYHVTLYQDNPYQRLAQKRAQALRDYFSRYLLINPARVEVEVLRIAERGDATSCVLPPESGPAIKAE